MAEQSKEGPYESPVDRFRGREFTPEELDIRIAPEIVAGGVTLRPAAPPAGFVNRDDLGILVSERLSPRRIHAWPKPFGFAEPQRAVITPGGDYLMMAAVGWRHQWGNVRKVNEIVAYRSADRGSTWTGPVHPWVVPYSQHAFNPLIPRGGTRIYSFGTDFVPDKVILPHNGVIPIRYSDDDGRSWSEPEFIKPVNDPEYRGVGHMQGCETDAGTWLLGTYFIDKPGNEERRDLQYLLRSEDKGRTWTLLPDRRPRGWSIPGHRSIMEGQPVNVGGGEILFMVRTPEGRLWESRSTDDGRTWSTLAPTSLMHPYSPPMVFPLADRRTLVAFTHNRAATDGFTPFSDPHSRSELWISTSADTGHTWSEPRFLLANSALADSQRPGVLGSGSFEVDYGDLIVDGEDLHFFFDHRKRQVLAVHFTVGDIAQLPTKAELRELAR